MSKDSLLAHVSDFKSSGRLWLIVGCYGLLILLVEILADYVDLSYGIIGSVLILLTALNQSARNRNNELSLILPALSLVPFLRLIRLALPDKDFPIQVNYILVAIPMFLAIIFIARNQKLSLNDLGLENISWKTQIPFAFIGIPLGLIGYLILRPSWPFPVAGLLMQLIDGAIVFLFVTLLDEILFRGIVLFALAKIDERFAVFISSMLYAALHLGTGSLLYALFTGAVGWLFARHVIKTHSLWGVIAANFLFVIGAGLVWPSLF